MVNRELGTSQPPNIPVFQFRMCTSWFTLPCNGVPVARNHFSLDLCHCFGCGLGVVWMWFGRGSDAARMCVRGGSDMCSDLAQTASQKLRESGFQQFPSKSVTKCPIFVGRFVTLCDTSRHSVALCDTVFRMSYTRHTQMSYNVLKCASLFYSTCYFATLCDRNG